MLTCQFYGGRLAEVMQTIASLIHFVYYKNININNIILPYNYCGSDFEDNKTYVIYDNYPIFRKLDKFFRNSIDYSKFEERDFHKSWDFYTKYNDYNDKDIIIKNHWIDFIYHSCIYKDLYYQKDLWNNIKNQYKSLFNRETLAIHVRRKDFLKIDNNKELYPNFKSNKILSSDEINKIIYESTRFNILMFSDDMEWCKNNINHFSNVYFIENNKPYQDLILMSMCDNIMRSHGSSFSKMAESLRLNK